MRVTLPLLRIPSARAPILRYGVAVLSTALALIPTILLADVSESRLALFGVAVMVSAWYGGWKPGVVATAFALTVSAYFSLAGEHTPQQLRTAIIRLSLFFFRRHADLLAQRRPARRAGKSAPLRAEFPFAGHQRSLRHLPLRFYRQDSRRQSRVPRSARPRFLRRTHRPAHFRPLRRQRQVVRPRRLSALRRAFQGAHRRVEAQGRHDHRSPRLRTRRRQRRRRHGLRTLRRRRYRTPRPRAATPPVAENGSRRPPRRRHRPRLQQSSDGHPRLLRIPARTPRRRASPARSRPGNRQRRRTRLVAHSPAPGLQPQADARPQRRQSERRRHRKHQEC